MDGETATVRKATVAQIAVAILFVALLGRLFSIQIVNGPAAAQAAEAQQNRTDQELPRRGDIRAADGSLLATSVRVPSLYANPAQMANPSGVARLLADTLGLDPVEVERRLSRRRSDGRPRQFAWLARFLSESEAETIRQLQVHGLALRYEYKRRYPNGAQMAHILGFVTRDATDQDNTGQEGVEREFDSFLRGSAGSRTVAVDGRRRTIGSIESNVQPVQDGAHLVLTIEPEVQRITESALAAAYSKWKADGAAAVVLRVHTGEILAMASFPTFDPARPGSGDPESHRNRAVSAAWDPGSTFKPFTIGAALTEGKVTPDTTIVTQGAVGGRVINDHVRASELSVHEVIVQSSNIGAVRIGLRVGGSLLRDYVLSLGFGAKTHVELPGEVAGLVPTAPWRADTTKSVAFGQEITVTPLQLAAAFSTLANGGIYFRPTLLKRIENSDGTILKQNAPQEKYRVFPYEVVEQIRPMLADVVTRGTGKRAATASYQVFGKTGTAQQAIPNGGGFSNTHYVGYFVGFASGRHDTICVLVAIDYPKGKYYGGTVAAPSVATIIEQSLRHLDNNPSEMRDR